MSVNIGGKEVRRGDKVMSGQEKKEDDKLNPLDYACEILLSKTTMDKAKDKSLPSDAFIVTYVDSGDECIDVTRSGKQSNVFDMYWDKYNSGLRRIEWGHGTVNPSQYGYKKPQKKRRKG
tara:strand:+ start:87 stop:446 length:360 start_codon:yes stop_codon:yes gene_type:complete